VAFDVLQIDDGWQIKVGDWLPNSKFKKGMRHLADVISKKHRRTPGLWLAPLIAQESSDLFQTHPHWFLRDKSNQLVSAGFNWFDPLYALDVTHPEVISFLTELMRCVVHDWGYTYLKLDFLYAGALEGDRYDKTKTREEAMSFCLSYLRQAMGSDTFFLTCGVPIMPGLAVSDAMRIGPDVSDTWIDPVHSEFLCNPAIPSACHATRTCLGRYWLMSLCHIDPDVSYFGKENNLTDEEKSILHNLGRITNFKAISDIPIFWSAADRADIREFIKPGQSKIKRINYSTFEIDGNQVSFAKAVPIPTSPLPTWLFSLLRWVFSFLLKQHWVMRFFAYLDDMKYAARRQRARIAYKLQK
jgi:alpha-galactosidase